MNVQTLIFRNCQALPGGQAEVHTLRRFVTACLYLLMIVGGGYLCWGWIAHGGKGVSALAGGSLALFGGYMFWTDFLSRDRL